MMHEMSRHSANHGALDAAFGLGCRVSNKHQHAGRNQNGNCFHCLLPCVAAQTRERHRCSASALKSCYARLSEPPLPNSNGLRLSITWRLTPIQPISPEKRPYSIFGQRSIMTV